MSTNLNFSKGAHTLRLLATILGGCAAFGAALGIYEASGSYLIAGLAGLMIAMALAGGWHTLLGWAPNVRRASGVATLVAIGVALTLIALVTSASQLATVMGGYSAQRGVHEAAIADASSALAETRGRLSDQDAIVNAVLQASTGASMLAEEEGRSGEGPKFRSLQRVSAYWQGVAAEVTDTIDEGRAKADEAEAMLAEARRTAGTPAFGGNIVEAHALLSQAASVSVQDDVSQRGVVELDTGGVPALTAITQRVYAASEAAEVRDVTLPTFTPVDRLEAMWAFPKASWPAWALAIGIDTFGLLALILVLILHREPLLRFEETPKAERKAVSHDEIRVNEDNVIGIRDAAE